MFNFLKTITPTVSDFKAAYRAVKEVKGELQNSDKEIIAKLMFESIPNSKREDAESIDINESYSNVVCKKTFLKTTVSAIVARKEEFKKSQFNNLINIANQIGISIEAVDSSIQKEVAKLPKDERRIILGF